jgi:zinc ribbon protein
MTEPGGESKQSSRCPWCSAEVAPDAARCPSCGATLREEEPADIPGVTQLDPAATVARPAPRTRSLIGWLSGQYETATTETDRGGVEPPSDAVKQEMLRLEIEAIRVDLEAEAAAHAADAGTIPEPAPAPGPATEPSASEPPPSAPEPPSAPDEPASGGGAGS